MRARKQSAVNITTDGNEHEQRQCDLWNGGECRLPAEYREAASYLAIPNCDALHVADPTGWLGPRAVKFGGSLRLRRSDLDEWSQSLAPGLRPGWSIGGAMVERQNPKVPMPTRVFGSGVIGSVPRVTHERHDDAGRVHVGHWLARLRQHMLTGPLPRWASGVSSDGGVDEAQRLRGVDAVGVGHARAVAARQEGVDPQDGVAQQVRTS